MNSPTPIWRRPRARFVAVLTLVWVIVFGITALAWRVLLPFVLAALVAYVIDPLICAITRLRVRGRVLPRWGAVLGVYAVIGLMLWLASVSVVPQMYRELMRGTNQLHGFVSSLTPDKIDAWAHTINDYLVKQKIPLDVLGESEDAGTVSIDLASTIADALQNASGSLTSHVGDLVTFSRALVAGTVQAIFFVVLLLMITAFISIDVPHIVAFLESLVPRAWRADFHHLLSGIDAGLSGVVRGQLTIMMVNGVFTLAGLLILRIPFAFALAALATVLYIVPILGTILSSVPIVLVGLTQDFKHGLFALLWILGVHALETYVLNPKIMGKASRIHPILIVLALVFGEQTFGLVGALLAVPIASVIAAIFKFLLRKAEELDLEAERRSG